MSRIGKHPVALPQGVTVQVANATLTAKGKIGALTIPIEADVTAKVEDGKVVDVQPFLEGFLDVRANSAWGRPVDVQVMPDGALLVSDDKANAIYRISWRR